VLPDVSAGQSPDTLARIESRRKEGMARFLASWYKFYRALRVSRLPRASAASDGGTSFIGTANISPVTKLVAGTGAVSRYKLSRSQKLVKVQDFNCVQMRVSGCNSHYKFVLSAGAKVEERSDEIPPWRGKKCDKPINYTVRVGCSFLFIIVTFSIFLLFECNY